MWDLRASDSRGNWEQALKNISLVRRKSFKHILCEVQFCVLIGVATEEYSVPTFGAIHADKVTKP